MFGIRAAARFSFTAARAVRKAVVSRTMKPDRAMRLTRSADVCVIGGGIIGRCTALALAARGVRVDLVSHDLPGASSRAAAGLLAPSIEGGSGAAHAFAVAARDAYPEFLERLASDVGGIVEHSRAGILDVALDDESETRLRALAASSGSPWLSPNEVRSLEPAIAPTRGGILSPDDGYVDNSALMDALLRATAAHPRVREVAGLAARLELERAAVTLVLTLGDRVPCAASVLAAGAWSAGIVGLPRPIPVRPLKGQMIAFEPAADAPVTLHRPVYGAGVYAVPRGATRVLIGATSEESGFAVDLTGDAAEGLALGARQLFPRLQTMAPVDHWAGLRPMSSDALPTLGSDPEYPALIYACGHSRNGILKAPLTGQCVAALFVGEACAHDLSPFAPLRHEAASAAPPLGG